MKLFFPFIVPAVLAANEMAIAAESDSFSVPTVSWSGKLHPVADKLVISKADRKLNKKTQISSRSNKSSKSPSVEPSFMPSVSAEPSAVPSVNPSLQPSAVPSTMPSLTPSSMPSLEPSTLPSIMPSTSSAPSACSEKICTSACTKILSSVGENDAYPDGIFFDIIALHDVNITKFFLYFEESGSSEVELYTRPGSYKSFERTSDGWNKIFSGSVDISETTSNLEGFSLEIDCGETRGVLIYSKDTKLAYTRGGTEGDTHLFFDKSLELTVGAGIVGTPFRASGEGSTLYFPRMFDGGVM